MKRLVCGAFAAFLIVVSIISFYDYIQYCDNFYVDGMQRIKIEKKQGQDNEQFIKALETITEESGCDIAYCIINNSGKKMTEVIYKTNWPDIIKL